MPQECPVERVLQVIQTQFDYEIYLKRREIHAIKEEIERAESYLETLELSILSNHYATQGFYHLNSFYIISCCR